MIWEGNEYNNNNNTIINNNNCEMISHVSIQSHHPSSMSVDKTRLIFFALKYLFNEDIDQFAINMVLKESIFVTQSISPHFWHMCDDSDIIVSIMGGRHLNKIHDHK